MMVETVILALSILQLSLVIAEYQAIAYDCSNVGFDHNVTITQSGEIETDKVYQEEAATVQIIQANSGEQVELFEVTVEKHEFIQQCGWGKFKY